MAADFLVHQSAFVDSNAQIGSRAKVWHFCHIMDGAQIGEDCILGQNVFVARNVKIGKNVKIQNNVSVYEGVTLEDDVFCGPSVVFTNVATPRSAYPKDSESYKATLVRRGSTIGANATLVCGVTLGEFSFVGAGAVVTRDVPDYALVFGVPATLHGWMCRCGKPLSFSGEKAICSQCNGIYKMISRERIKSET